MIDTAGRHDRAAHGTHGDRSEITRVTWVGLAVNLFLSAVKFITGYLGMSQAVMADAFHSLSDIITDLAILLGVRFWSRPADHDHPYGHSRIETMVTAFIALTLFAAGVGIGYNALTTLRDADIAQPGIIATVGAAFSIVLKEGLYRWTLRVGRRSGSSSVVANAWHHRSDAISSIPAFAAVLLASLDPRMAFVDHLGAFIVCLFIVKVSWDLIKPTLVELSDRGACGEDLQRIEEIAMGVEGVLEVHAIRSRRHGQGIFVDLHVLVDGAMSVRDGHDIASRVKGDLLKKGPEILDVVVHLEPFDSSTSHIFRTRDQ